MRLAVYSGDLYAGTGNATGSYGTVWKSHNGTGREIGGGGLNSSWNSANVRSVYALTEFNGPLYAGMGINANSNSSVPWLYKWNGSTWTQVASGGTGTSGQSWANAHGYRVRSLAVYQNN